MSESGKKVIVRQVRSQIGRTQKHIQTLKALGLGRIGKSFEHTLTPSTLGMVKRVGHLVSIEESK